jgi:hypothetical protein
LSKCNTCCLVASSLNPLSIAELVTKQLRKGPAVNKCSTNCAKNNSIDSTPEGLLLDKAVAVFWAKGYEATSMQDLVDAMGIQRGSLYATFGSKQQLFLQSLERYGKVVVPKVA